MTDMLYSLNGAVIALAILVLMVLAMHAGCALGLALYLPGIMWGVPYASAPDRISAWGSDETAPLGSIAQVLHYVLHADTQLDPRYPLLVYLVQLVFMAPYVAFLWLTDGLALGMSREYPFGLADPVGALSTMTLAARVPRLLMAAALAPIAYATARTLWDHRTAVCAGAFAVVFYPLFFYSRTGHVDSHAMFWTALCLLVFAQYLRHGLTRRRAVLLGLFAALATASKDQSYAICGTAWLVVLVRSAWPAGPEHRQEPLASHLLAGLATGAVVYAVTSGLALNPPAFLTHVDFIMHGSGKGPHLYFANEATLAGYANVLLEFVGHIGSALGGPTALAAAAGLVLAASRDRRALLLVLPVFGLLAGVSRTAGTVSLRVSQIADDVQLAPDRFERCQNLGQFEILTGLSRGPARHRCPVRNVDETGANFRHGIALSPYTPRRHHRLQQRQGQYGTGALQQRAARQMFPG
jgi:hypothetical protein